MIRRKHVLTMHPCLADVSQASGYCIVFTWFGNVVEVNLLVYDRIVFVPLFVWIRPLLPRQKNSCLAEMICNL
jgi:hypothetical protein